ncbi:MAG: group III truncated hemoglobin [Sphingobacteriaceae bacterium]
MRRDIETRADIELMVDTFYEKVKDDDLIGPIFNTRIAPDAWPKHLERMYTFWTTILLSQPGYSGNPFDKHRDMPIEQAHFDRWVSLFKNIIDLLFEGPVAKEAKYRADLMGHLFLAKLTKLRELE